jgi:hypothetical protein
MRQQPPPGPNTVISAPPGYYPDAKGNLRYWNGSYWGPTRTARTIAGAVLTWLTVALSLVFPPAALFGLTIGVVALVRGRRWYGATLIVGALVAGVIGLAILGARHV